jgi:molybdopterin molybdotransferase
VSQAIKAAKSMMTVVQARAAMLSHAAPLGVESVALDRALGRVLAKTVQATRDLPPFAVSAMDGYAIRSADAPGMLTVRGEAAAGAGFDGVCDKGGAIRISTGAAIPAGADAVVIQEDVERDGAILTVPSTRPHQHVRPQGGDFRAGTTLLEAGRQLDGVAVSLAAAAGLARLDVMRQPRIAILSSGNELAAPGTVPGPWQIFDSATFGIAGLVRGWGGACNRLAVERDDATAIARAAEAGLRDSDLLVVIGGASVGDHDHARPALMKLGLSLAVEKVAVRPGKPTWFGKTPGGLVLGLPGNPASALVCAQLFLKPLIRAMLGQKPDPVLQRACLDGALPANGQREHYLRAQWRIDGDGRLMAKAFEDQDSSLISTFAAANALIRLPPDMPAQGDGALIDMMMLGPP